MENVLVLQVVDTIYTADSVEWCPIAPYQNIFVCANYQLAESANNTNDEPRKRFGKIRLYSLDDKNDIKLHQIVDNEAVLDQKWGHYKINDFCILAVVSAKNTLEIYKLIPEKMQLCLITRISNEDDEVLMLSLDWSTGKYFSDIPSIVTSDSKGKISIFELNNNELQLKWCINAHSFEAWICAFYYWNTSLIFSGGDDAKLLQFDLRENDKPIFKCNEFTAGVTSIHSNADKEFILATGSYDSRLLIWDIRNMKQYISTLTLPDSVWRLKWNPNNFNYLLAACMRQGFHILNVFDIAEPKVVCDYYEHKDIAYGCDWKYSEHERDEYIIACCSFYDHKLSVAKVDVSTCQE